MNFKKFLFIGLGLMVLAIIFAPLVSFAHPISLFPKGYWGPIVPSDIDATTATFCTFFETIRHAMYLGLTLVLFIVLPITIMYGGALVLTSAGNAERVGQGKSAVTGALVGIAIALCAYLIVNTFFTALGIALPKGGKWDSVDCNFEKTYKLFQKPGATSNTTQ